MKEKKRKNKWQFQILIVFIISLIGIGFWSSLKEKSELKNSKITVGTITEIEERFQRGFFVQYEFIVNGKKYTENQKLTIKKESIKIGDKFEINYSENNPEYNELEFEKRVVE
ncbi:hypothetical protein M3P19_13105 [Muricauda sp. 2012CJ35-5]|uniref:DUF3592 domain-containing protein n=1 Tax=Flagellimonas spongiicola TaxID=2942208 RepID=A0ABT0PU85_9FLAO|nr:hypothetical protein [Allomuricauda spongiicola]MCL6274953.1 hypothetical protein [Allomuricauda spongiicola]